MSRVFQVLLSCLIASSMGMVVKAAEVEPGFKSLFNGHDLSGWEGLPQFWSVRDGAITGQTTKENPAKGNTFLVWKDGEVSDFELRLSYKITPNNNSGFANSGIQYRSKIADPKYFVVGGYQADMEAGKAYSGILYEERGRGILAQRGQKVVIHPGTTNPKTPRLEVTGSLGKSEDIQAKIKADDWNEYVIIVKGNHLQHFINGQQTIDVLDEQTEVGAKTGVLALQLHAGDPMTVQFKDIRIKSLSERTSAQLDLDKLQGNWVAVSIVENGEKAGADALAALKLKIKENRFWIDRPDGSYQGKFELKANEGVKAIDVVLDDGTEVQGIYSIGADTIQVCHGEPGSARPSTFSSSEGSQHLWATYRHEKL